MFLSERQFEQVVEYTPLVSVDLIIENSQNEFLVGKRINRPACGFLFVPGGRVFKNESISKAFKRIIKKEINIECSIEEARFIGVFEHFYNDSFVNDQIETHYVVLAYYINIGESEILFDSQHESVIWMSRKELLLNNLVHQNTLVYFQ